MPRPVRAGRTRSRARCAACARRGRDYGALRALLRADVDVVAAGLTGLRGRDRGGRGGRPRAARGRDQRRGHRPPRRARRRAGRGRSSPAPARSRWPRARTARWARADGWGTLLGDDGGGYWIGRAGLASALRARDGRGGSAELLRPSRGAARRQTPAARRDETVLSDGPAPGPGRADGRGAIVAAVYDAPDPVAVVASFARDVADAARAGDETALEHLGAGRARAARGARSRPRRRGRRRRSVLLLRRAVRGRRAAARPVAGRPCPASCGRRSATRSTAPAGCSSDPRSSLTSSTRPEPHDATWPPVHRRGACGARGDRPAADGRAGAADERRRRRRPRRRGRGAGRRSRRRSTRSPRGSRRVGG